MIIDISNGPAKPNSPPPVSDAQLHRYCEFLALWRLCRSRRCHRGQRCCGVPRECMRRRLPLVPNAVQTCAVGFYSMKKLGEPFDCFVSSYGEELGEYEKWLGALHQAATRPVRRRSDLDEAS